MASLYFVTLVVFVGIVGAQDKTLKYVPPKPCCMPDQWTGQMHESVGTNRRGKGGLTNVAVNMTYDYTNKRMALHEYIFSAGFRMAIRLIAMKGKAYLINDKTKKCTVTKLKAPIMPPCIPKKARYLRQVTYGTGSNSLKVNAWKAKITSPSMRAEVLVSVTEDCIPVDELVFGRNRMAGFMAAVTFHDVVKGIKDPSVFKIPASCKKEKVSALKSSPMMNMFNALLR